jgi:hypothetical protein
MKKDELALAVARARRRAAPTWAAARACRAQFAEVATASSERLATIAVLLRRLSGNSRTDGSRVTVMVAAFRRLWWRERIAFPLAAVVLAGVLGAAMPLLLDRETAQGGRMEIAAPIPASQGSSDIGRVDQKWAIAGSPTRGRSTAAPQKSAVPAGSRAGPTGVRTAAVVAAQEEGSSSFDQSSEAQAGSSKQGASEPSESAGGEPDVEKPKPEPSADPAPDVEKPTPQPSADPAPGSPVNEEAKKDEQAGGKVTLCHKASSKKSKTIVVGGGAVEEHLTHGDSIGVCP